MGRLCKRCLKAIPKVKRASAVYCSDQCYYESKKDRSNQQYHDLKEMISPFKENETLLEQFYPFIALGQPITYQMLDSLGFNWSISQGQGVTNEKDVWQLIGKYYYKINPDKTVSICKVSTQ